MKPLEEKTKTGDQSRHTGWIWEDFMIQEDFKKLRKPQEDIDINLICLKAFYSLYFGTLKETNGVASLFAQIIARAQSPIDEGVPFIDFSGDGKIDISEYRPPGTLEKAFEEMLNLKELTQTTMESRVEVTTVTSDPSSVPRETLAGDLSTDPLSVPIMAIHERSPEEETQFLTTVQLAFTAYIGEKPKSNRDPSNTQSKSHSTPPEDLPTGADLLKPLIDTAIYLSLVMMRRLVKRTEDLEKAFGRENINKHYGMMISRKLSRSLPAPAMTLNRSLEAELSTNFKGSRHLFVMVLHLFSTAEEDLSDKRSGLLEQKHSGISALLKATCLTHLAGVGLPLITLFKTLKALYRRTDKETLELVAYRDLVPGCQRIASLLTLQDSLQTKSAEKGPLVTFKLFPYCRLIHSNYHVNLSAQGNEAICYLMACLIDLKFPPASGSGGAKTALWTSKLADSEKRLLGELSATIHKKRSTTDITPEAPNADIVPHIPVGGNVWATPTIQQAQDPQDDDSESDDSITYQIP